MRKEIVKILGNVIAFTFLAGEKAFVLLFRRRVTRLGDHSVTRATVVHSHHVLSGRLMDAPTGRLYPSARHRVPPWVPPAGE